MPNSGIWILFVIVAIIFSVLRRVKQGQQPPYRTPPHMPQRPPTRRQQPYSQQTSAMQQQQKQEQSAWDWMHSTPAQRDDARDPEGETLMYRDVPEDWIRPVEATVHVDLTEMHESKREIVHETVHESLHVRSDTASGTSQPTRQPKGKVGLSNANLAQALILAEALGEPRSKRPWHPKHRR